jgi:hypothetical protein
MYIENGPDKLIGFDFNRRMNAPGCLTVMSGTKPLKDRIKVEMDAKNIFEGLIHSTALHNGVYMSEYLDEIEDLRYRKRTHSHQQLSLAKFIKDAVGVEAQFFGAFDQKLEYWPQLEGQTVASQLLFLAQKYGFFYYARGAELHFLRSDYRSKPIKVEKVLDQSRCIESAYGSFQCLEELKLNTQNLEYESVFHSLADQDFAKCRMEKRQVAEKKYEGWEGFFDQAKMAGKESVFFVNQGIDLGDFFQVGDCIYLCSGVQASSETFGALKVIGMEVK